MTKKEAWQIFYESPHFSTYWEDETTHSGLLLSICSRCGEKQTRKTYLRGFIADYFTLIQDYAITAIAKHNCGQWHRDNG